MSNSSIMIIDDHPVMRHGLRQLVESEKKFIVAAETNNGSDAINIASKIQPNIIMMDINLSNMKGIEIIRQLRKYCLQTYVLILSFSANRNDIYSAMDAGANGYLLKDCELDMLMNSIRRAAQGHTVFSEKVYQFLINRHKYQDPLSFLTKREFEVLQEISSGLKNKEISKALFISEETVKVHIRNLLKKLQARSRLEASLIYLRTK
ncbi:response regulator [Moellerella wisconsensis]|uniref:Nitrate/nitrite response regulator protein n=3 Tax=Moellerella wisconsensis TaxID=158849 RepID=A0A0N0ZAR8_9GAMM|nr:response regulator [Moellerella wisconsensis]KLN96497.1 transcriptional regulator NarP [Moellerella wisconsensis]KPD02658.1 nitrate/nitrite response regulator protein [Moellerella wisconsensis ATCC 35017]UNH22949.1 response regulator [Moellerella wisconsensis]UNH26088.1 response regulator [Moellerella wisconsensis]UNH29502.1 response regulator [Moellerella wisconsensis]